MSHAGAATAHVRMRGDETTPGSGAPATIATRPGGELYAVLPDGWAVLGPRLREDKNDWVVWHSTLRGQTDTLREAYGDTEGAARALAQSGAAPVGAATALRRHQVRVAPTPGRHRAAIVEWCCFQGRAE